MARLRIRTPAELRRLARMQTGEEIRGELQPYTSELNQTSARRKRALADLQELYGGLNRYAGESAQRVRAASNQSVAAQQQLFDQAASRLDQFRQQRAAEAQALAQQTGGPVPMSAFTEGVDIANVAPHAAAGALLHSLALGQAQVGEAESFAGKVFPLVQMEETQKASLDYEDQISKIEDEIAKIKASSRGRTNTRYNELLIQERQAELDRLRADRDYEIAKGTLGVQRFSAQTERQQGAASLDEQKRQFDEQLAASQEQALQTREDEAYNLIDAIATGGEMRDYKDVQWVPVGFMTAREAAKKGYFLDPNDKRTQSGGKRMYYQQKASTRTLPSNLHPVAPDQINPATGQPWGTDAYQEIYHQLIGRGVRSDIARKVVRDYFGLGAGWNPSNYKRPKRRSNKPPAPKKKSPKKPAGAKGPAK